MRFLSAILILLSSNAFAADRYANFAELSQHAKEGDDYTVTAKNRKSRITVMAIHGGAIEPHSEELATAIAKEDLNLYTFVAAPKDHSTDLHLTSTHFDEPKALVLAEGSEQCISVHGYLEREKDGICVGGGDVSLRKKIVTELNKLGLSLTIEEPCTRFGGSAPTNIVNRCKLPGVQLEVSTHLRNAHADWFKQIAEAVRRAVLTPEKVSE